MIERIQRRLAKALATQGAAKAIRTHSGAALGSSVGLVRNRNEDCCVVVRASYVHSGRTNFTVAMVCDGLGGMSQGREAAILAASAFTAHLFSAPLIGWKKRLSDGIAYANAQVYQLLGGDGGTTLSAVISSQDETMLCHVGDSRVYGVMPDRALEQLSRDDTINALLKRQASKAEALKDSRLLQFVGMGEEMEAQITAVSGHFRSILLTSDGAHDVPHSVFQRVVTAAVGGSDLIRKLLILSDVMGGRDNASAVLLPIGTEAERSDEIWGDELLAILPNDTLTINIVAENAWEQSGNMHDPSPSYSLGEPNKRIEETPSPEEAVDNNPKSKPTALKGRGRTAKVRKPKRPLAHPKADAADHLPFGEPSNKVDVQFSDPATHPDEDTQ